MATDVYKLEWTRSRSTIQTGVSSIMHKDAFMDTIIVCSDGAMTHNKLTLGLVLPELHQVAVFDHPVEHTVLMPDYTTLEIQSLIGAIFPNSALVRAEAGPVADHDVELLEREENGAGQFANFLGNPGSGWEAAHPSWTGARRGRGRPPLSGARLPARFQCDYCNKGFYYRSMLTAHEKLHTGGKRETCEVCGAEYSTRQNLKNHMIKYHGADSFTPRKRGRPPVSGRGRAAPRSPLALTATDPPEVLALEGPLEGPCRGDDGPGPEGRAGEESNGLSGGSECDGEAHHDGAMAGEPRDMEALEPRDPGPIAGEPSEYQISEPQVEKLSILSRTELVTICHRNSIAVTGEKRALAARILRKLGPVFGEDA